ncbi:MAG: 4-hydroxy-tetrahydrodipicolinate synthase [Dehalococcoidia bacterium]|nr:4-hydroxy-tetrahydrodipicolinate synthase [Dehalococcoidia bacterium]MQF99699.1 4-hydroxy-tetrahydrodipicolinate synthase [SAR202 cluster bacterium]|tara:strand:- start:1668 stop:2561 length:894 start_codon:yes stop_codon:yes gene_type:complete
MVAVGRLITAMVTPFDDDGEVSYSQARRLARSLLDSGSDGLVVSGTTGESPNLSTDEKLRLFSELKDELGNDGSIVAGTGNYSTAESIELTQEAEKQGVDAALLVVPYYNKPTQDGLYKHFRAIAESTSLPCILYNVPSRTVTNLSHETVVSLSAIDNIIGVKEASGDFDQITRIISGASNGFNVWSGNDNDTFGIMCLGGYGVISVASHLIGVQIKDMIKLILDGKTTDAASEHIRLLEMFKGLFTISNPMPVRYGLQHIGFDIGSPRLPLTDPDPETAKQITELLRSYKIDFPVE